MPKNDDIIWVCVRDKGQGPPLEWAERGECHDCKVKVFFDPYLARRHPELMRAVRVCDECMAFRMIVMEESELKIKYPHRGIAFDIKMGPNERTKN